MIAGGESEGGGAAERRSHRRLNIRLPVECCKERDDRRQVVRTITQNISSGGMYLELDSADFHPGDRIHIELTVPPAEGVSSRQGRARCTAEVLRVPRVHDGKGGGVERFGVATRFLNRLRISY
jgi:hypothetical protein